MNTFEDKTAEWWDNCKLNVRSLLGTFGILQNKLDSLTADKLEGARLRSKTKYLQLYEKPSKYFLRTEKRRSTNKTINMLSTDEGEITSQPAIVNACVNFYSDRYTDTAIDENLKAYFLL